MIYLIEVERIFRATNVFEVDADTREQADMVALAAAKQHAPDDWWGDGTFTVISGETEDEHDRRVNS